MTYTIQGGAVLRAQAKLDSTNPTTLLSGRGAIIIGIYVNEITGNTPTLAYYTTDGTDDVYQRGAKAMTAYEQLRDELILPIAEDEELVFVAGAANQVDVTVAYISGDSTAKG